MDETECQLTQKASVEYIAGMFQKVEEENDRQSNCVLTCL